MLPVNAAGDAHFCTLAAAVLPDVRFGAVLPLRIRRKWHSGLRCAWYRWMGTPLRLAAAALSASLFLAVFGSRALAAGPPVKLFVSATTDGAGHVMPLSDETRDLLQGIEQASGLAFDVRPVPWPRALRMATQGDGLLYGATMTAERRKTLAFSEPLYRESVWLVTRCDRAIDYRQLSQLDGLSIGAVRGTVNGPDFDAAVSAGRFRLDFETGDSRARFEKLLLGRTDALLMYSRWSSQEVALVLQARYGGMGVREADSVQRQPFCVMPRPVFSDDVRIAAALGHHAEALKRINHALVQMRDAGRLPQAMREAAPGRRQP